MPLLAYLDPGAGSLILQVILGTIAAGWVFFRHLLQRLRALGGRPAPQGDEPQRPAAPQPAPPQQAVAPAPAAPPANDEDRA